MTTIPSDDHIAAMTASQLVDCYNALADRR